MHLILTGATGLVGCSVLAAMVRMKDVTRISILSRRPVVMAEAINDVRVTVIIHEDFNQYPKHLLEQLGDATGCVWALGISQVKVDADDYVRVTKDYPLSFARAFQAHATAQYRTKPFNFVYVSAYGATFQPRFWTPLYARVKGQTEIELAKLRHDHPWFHAMTARPNAVDPRQHPEILPFVPADAPIMGRKFALLVSFFARQMPWTHSPTRQLAQVLTELAMGLLDETIAESVKAKGLVEKAEGDFVVLENTVLRRFGGLD